MEGGIHIYCINLKHRGDRWERFSKQPELGKLMQQYTFERFEAINGATLDIQKDERISLRTKRNIKEHIRRDHEELDSAGGVGCYLSHTTVWKMFLERPEAYAIIFEDDAILEEGFADSFQRALKDATLLPQIPDVWFFSRPESWYYEVKGKPNPLTVPTQNLGPWTTKTCALFSGYLITKKGAEKLLETAFPLDMHVDQYTCLNADLKRIFSVSHRNVEVRQASIKQMDSDIRVATDCHICNIPTNYEKRGMIVVSLPALVLGLGATWVLWRLSTTGSIFGGLRRR